MNLSIYIFPIIAALFVWQGYRRGFAKSMGKYLSYFFAYFISIIFTVKFADFITKYFPLDGLIVYFIAAIIIFFGSTFLINFAVGKIINVVIQGEIRDLEVSKASKIGGGVLGLLAGCFVGLLMVYVVNFSYKMSVLESQNLTIRVQDVNEPAKEIIQNESPNIYSPIESSTEEKFIEKVTPPIDKPLISEKESFIDSIANRMVGATARAVVDLTAQSPAAKTLTKALSKDPVAMVENFQRFINDENVLVVLSDPEIQNLLRRGNSEALLKSKKFQLLLQNQNMKAMIANEESGQTNKEIAGTMIMVWKKTEAVKDDPRVIEIISDPEFIKQMNSANTMQILTDPKIKELTEIIANK